ncbi:MAG TPA: hypothetical protein H9979_01070 [Candidatus Megamonas gallistercoris]|nr:hypothetical protein [Candidatus Megamonas gallistercoris]
MKCTRIFLLIIAGFVFWSSNTYVSAKNASDDVAQHSNYNEIRQYYNLAQNRDEDGLLLEEKYRQVYPDVKNGEFNIYWGQPLDEISTVYELKWGVWSTNVGRYVLQLNKIYKRSSPYLILWFNKEKLYKIWMYYPRGLQSKKHNHGRVVNDLTQKFGTPTVYNENILVWEDFTVKVNSIEEEQLEKKFLNNVVRHRKHAASR